MRIILLIRLLIDFKSFNDNDLYLFGLRFKVNFSTLIIIMIDRIACIDDFTRVNRNRN